MSKSLLSCVRGFVLALVSIGTLVALALSGVAVLLALPGPAWAYTNCPNEAFRVGPSANLPDCRAYEQVSPPDKDGGQVEGGLNFGGGASYAGGTPYQASLDGEKITYASAAVFNETGATAGVLADQYLSVRTAAGWRTQEIVPEQNYPEGRVAVGTGAADLSLYQGFSEDLSHAFLLSYGPPLAAGAPAGYYNPYVRDDLTGAYTLLNTVKPPVWASGEPAGILLLGFNAGFAGFSSDYRHVIFEADDALTPGAAPGKKNLYEYNEGEGLELVNVLPNGKTAEVKLAYKEGQEGLTANYILENNYFNFGSIRSSGQYNPTDSPSYVHAISADGSRAFWTGPEVMVYMHERTGSGARTVPISAGSALFWAASVDGSLVYFNEGGDLYQYDVASGVRTAIASGVSGVFGISEDGSYVYYESSEGLYLWHAGVRTPIAPPGDVEAGTEIGADVRTSRVTPDGRFLVFESHEPYTGYDNLNTAACTATGQGQENFVVTDDADSGSGGRCNEVFEYDAESNKLLCVSCNPAGIPPVGDAFTPGEYHTLQAVQGWESSTVQQRYVNDAGTVFFDSEDALLPQASNHRMNVYEYEHQGVGSCASVGGCLYLISSGISSENSWFVDASANGADVFFLTSQQLVGQDGDEALDVYDARVDGGFSYGGAPPCAGEACRPAVTPAPQIYTAPPSETFEGAGDATVTPAGEPSQPKTAKRKTKSKQTKHRARKQTKRRATKQQRKRHGSRGSKASLAIGRRSEQGRQR